MITITTADEAFLHSISAPEKTEAMVLKDGDGQVEGYATFRMDGDTVELLLVREDDPLMVDALIRSVLNTGDYRGAVWGICRDDAFSSVLPRLEFQKKDGIWKVSIEEFFRSGCSCGEKPLEI